LYYFNKKIPNIYIDPYIQLIVLMIEKWVVFIVREKDKV